MEVYETSGVMAYMDENSNLHLHYPITKAENIEYNNSDLASEFNELSATVEKGKPLSGTADPTSSTKGSVGQHYTNTTTGNEFNCIAADKERGVYTWKAVGGSGGSLALDSIKIATLPTKTAYKAGEVFDPTGMVVTADYSISGVVVAKDQPVTGYTWEQAAMPAGKTSVTITYAEGGVTKTATAAVTVTKTDVAIPTYSGNLVYTGSEQTPTFDNDPGALAAKSGNTAETNASDSYVTRFTLADTDLYEWSDGSTSPKDVSWSIGRKATTLSVSPSSVTLDADHLTVTAAITTDGDGALSAESGDTNVATANVSGSTVTVESVNSASGTATVTVRQAAGTNYLAASATIEVYAEFFSATLNVTAVPGATVTATSGGNSYQATAGSNGVATLSIGASGTYSVVGAYQDAASNTQSVAVTQDGGTYSTTVNFITLALTAPNGSSVTLTNGTKTFTGTGTGAAQTYYLPATGTWEATATNDSKTATGSVNVSAYQAYTLTLAFVSKTLNDNSWAVIKEVSDADKGDDYWDTGDVKEVTLNGTVGSYTFSNLKVNAFIIGFNHNSAKEGTHRIHFMFGKINGTAVAFCDSKYNSQGSTGNFVMNTSNTNSGGWNGSYMRKTVLGNDGTPSSPPTNSFMAALPSDLRSVMKSVTKYTDNTGNSSNTEAAVTATTDYLFLLAEFEAFGTRYGANQYEQNKQLQYAYFSANNTNAQRIAYNHTAASAAVWWWLRSATYATSNGFRGVSSGGSISSNAAYYSGGLRPGFAA